MSLAAKNRPVVANAEEHDERFGRGLRRIAMVVELLTLSGKEAVAQIAPLVHAQLRVLPAPGVAPARSYETREEFLDYFAEAKAHGIRIEPDASEIRVSPLGAVLVAGALRVTSPGGVNVTPAWFVYTFRDGLIASLGNYLDREMAEGAAGLARPHGAA